MTKSDLENKLKPFTDSITDGTLSTMSAIRLHLSLLLDIRKIGVPIPVILEITGCPYSPSTFSDKLSKLRKKMQDNTTKGSNQNHFINTPTQQSKEPAQEIISKTTKNEPQNNNEPDIDAWRETFAKNIHEKIPDNLIEKLARGLAEINVNLDNWHLFAKKHGIFNTKKLLYIFSNRRMYSFNEE